MALDRSPSVMHKSFMFADTYTADEEVADEVRALVEGYQINQAELFSTATEKLQKIKENLDDVERQIGTDELAQEPIDGGSAPLGTGMTAAGLVRGVPELSQACEIWKQVFGLVCRAANSAEDEGAAEAIAREYLAAGVRLVCTVDQLRLGLKNVGDQTSSFVLHQEKRDLQKLMSMLNVSGESNPQLARLLEDLRITSAAAQKKESDFEIPKELLERHAPAADADASPEAEEDDPFSHLADASYEIDDSPPPFQLEDLGSQDNATAMLNAFAEETGRAATAEPAREHESTQSTVKDMRHMTITVGDLQSDEKRPRKLEDDQGEGGGEDRDTAKTVESLIRQEKQAATNRGGGASRTYNQADLHKKQDVTVDSSAESKDIERIIAKLKPDAELTKRLLARHDKLEDTYDKSGAMGRVKDRPVLELPSTFRPRKKADKWTYELLSESRTVGRMVDSVTSTCRTLLAAHLQGVQEPMKINWCFVFDNSGSMVRVADGCAEALVILVETLRRLECHFAVATAGESVRLVKRMDESFSFAVGERILASFTYNEGTHLGSCAQSIAERVFPTEKRLEPNECRILVLVTDGLSRDLKDESGRQGDTQQDFMRLRERHQLELAVLHTAGRRSGTEAEMLRNITNDLYFPVVPGEAAATSQASMPVMLTQLIMQALQLVLNKQRGLRRGAPASPTAFSVFYDEPALRTAAESMFPVDRRVGKMDLATAARQGQGTRPEFMYNVSSGGGAPWKALEQDVDGLLDRDAIAAEVRAKEEMWASWVQQLQLYPKAAEALQAWHEAAMKLRGNITDMAGVLEEHVFPNNKYTRRRADFKGSQLHLQGLIKAVVTDFNYKKFFSSKTAGGRRSYGVALVLDTSLSMDGHLLDCAMESLVILVEAMLEVGVEHFSVITFGDRVQIVKPEGSEWGPGAILALLSSLDTSKQMCTRDADALSVALALLEASTGHTHKKVFMLTDGYSSSGLRLAQVLKEAQTSDVDVVALAVGMDQMNVEVAYPRWATAVLPSVLPEALRKLFEQESADAKPAPDTTSPEKGQYLSQLRLLRSGDPAATTEEIMRRAREDFASIAGELTKEREIKLERGSAPRKLQIDLLFVVDRTGSMAPILSQVRAQIRTIVSGETSLMAKIKKEHGDLDMELRCGMLAYRDFGDPEPFVDKPFTDQIDTDFIPWVERNLQAQGGGDLAEDVAGALDRAVGFDFRGQCRYILLIDDAPCHGSVFNGGVQDSHAGQSAQTEQRLRTALRALIDKRITLLHCTCDQAATLAMERGIERMLGPILHEATAENAQRPPEQRVLLDSTPERYFKSVPMTTDSTGSRQDPSGVHTVFVLDQSKSMSGGPWDELQRAYLQFLERRVSDQGGGDIVSVILFDSSPETRFSLTTIDSVRGRSLAMRGGGTSFAPAMLEAERLVNQTPRGKTPQVVFMSDGGAGDSEQAARTMGRMRTAHYASGFTAHVIAFGSGADMTALRRISTEGGTTVLTTPPGSLTSVMVNIAAGTQASDALFKEIGRQIAEAVSTRLILDFL
jgi:uncharacterized protein YegL